MPRAHEHRRVFGVVYQTNFLEAVQQLLCDLGGDFAIRQALEQFESTARGTRERAQHYRARPLLFFRSTGSGRFVSWCRHQVLNLKVDGEFFFICAFRFDSANTQLLLDLPFKFLGEFGVITQEGAGVYFTLPELIALIGVPSTRFADKSVLNTEVKQATFARDSTAVNNIEFGLFKRRSHLILDDASARAVSDRSRSLFQGLDPTHINAHRRVELQSLTTRGGFWASKEHTNLFAQLVNEERRSA